MIDFESVLKKKWGYDSFRPLQREIIESIMSGKDTVALLPTGAGKSLTYQLPAVVMEGITIVVTPLVSLMYDQVKSLRDKEILASYISSGMSIGDIDRILDNCIYGDVKLLYVAPERINSDLFQVRVQKMKVNLVAIDEAHCISQWGYNFRPSYLDIWCLRGILPDVPFLALTATATPMVVSDISKNLKLSNPNIYISSFERNNLRFVVREVQDKKLKLLNIISVLPKSWSGIIYCHSRLGTVDVSNFLNENGLISDFYHAGLDVKTRNMKQKSWMEGENPIMVATSAFGMGIDKPDVRYVIHYDMTDTLEEYYQQAGRAGRDGKEAYAVVIYSQLDLTSMTRRVKDEFPEIDLIKRVYDSLCRYLGIAIEYGCGTVKQFSLNDFCSFYRIYSSKVISSLKILQRNGYLTYYEEHERQTRIKFIVPKNELYNIENDYENIVISALLRNYVGLFSQFVAISEQFLSKITGISEENIPSILIRLSRQHIIAYIPRNSDSVIRFDMNRVSLADLTISPDTYVLRRNNVNMMSSFAKEYLIQSSRCRMQILCYYFGQNNVHKCGHCDICGNKENHIRQNDIEESIVDKALISYLKSTDMVNSIEQLSESIPYPMFEILLSLRRLIWSNIVYELPNGCLKVKLP